MSHEYFDHADKVLLSSGKEVPPFVPHERVDDQSPSFFTPTTDKISSKIDQTRFDGFSFMTDGFAGLG